MGGGDCVGGGADGGCVGGVGGDCVGGGADGGGGCVGGAGGGDDESFPKNTSRTKRPARIMQRIINPIPVYIKIFVVSVAIILTF